MSKHDHYKYGVGMCEGLFKDEEDCIPTINKRQFALGIISVCVKQMRPTEDLKKDEAFDAEYDQARLDKQNLILRCGKVAVEKGITDPEAIGKMMEFMKYILHDAECQDHRYGKCDCQVKEALKIYNQAIGKL